MSLKVAVGSKNFRDKCGKWNTFFTINYWKGLRDRRVFFGKEKPFHNQYTKLLVPCLGLHNTLCTTTGHTALVICCWSVLQNIELFSSTVTKLMTQEKVLVWQHWSWERTQLFWIWRHDSMIWGYNFTTSSC